MYIGEVHNEAIDEYIDSILSGKGLVYPFINEELVREIKAISKKMFLAGYRDSETTEDIERIERIEEHDCQEFVTSMCTGGFINKN